MTTWIDGPDRMTLVGAAREYRDAMRLEEFRLTAPGVLPPGPERSARTAEHSTAKTRHRLARELVRHITSSSVPSFGTGLTPPLARTAILALARSQDDALYRRDGELVTEIGIWLDAITDQAVAIAEAWDSVSGVAWDARRETRAADHVPDRT